MLTLGIAAATAIAVPTISEATIYLMKGEKIVASYPDDAVEYITFDDPTTPDIPEKYDVDTRSYFLNSNYYGDTQAASGYNYAVQLYDLPADEKGNIPFDAVYYTLLLKGPEVTDKKSPFIPEGTYTLGEAGSDGYIILSGESSLVIDKASRQTFKKAWLKVTKNESKWRYEFIATAANDKTYHTVFDGTPNAFNQSIDWLETDEHIQGGTIIGWYLDKSQGGGPDGNGNNITIQIAEKGYDTDGYLIKPCNYLTIIGNVDMDEKGNILPGTWTVHEKDFSEKNTIMSGRCVNFMGSANPVYTHLRHWSSDTDVSVGLITGGTMSVTSSKGLMTFRYDFTTDKGKKVSGLFQGQIMLRNHPYEQSIKLENDYTLDFSDRIATCRPHTWSGDIALEVYKFDSNIQYIGDRVGLTLIPKNGKIELQPGIYKVNEDANSVGKIVPGTFTAQTGVGSQSVFVKYSTENPGKVLKASGIKGGQIEVKKNTDNTWTIIYDLLDDQTQPKRITGSWTGNFKE